MTLNRGQSSPVSARLEALIAKHIALSKEIDEEFSHPASDDLDLVRKKKEKLKLKDEIEILSTS